MTTYPQPPQSFDELVAPYPGDIQEVAAELRGEIRGLAPDADENVYGGLKMAKVLYSLGSDTNSSAVSSRQTATASQPSTTCVPETSPV